jgi:hypothetical protein
MMFPVCPAMAASAGVPEFDYHVLDSPHARVGNSMLVGTFVMVHLAVMSNVELISPDEAIKISLTKLWFCCCFVF